jgi:hypothetical protein
MRRRKAPKSITNVRALAIVNLFELVASNHQDGKHLHFHAGQNAI